MPYVALSAGAITLIRAPNSLRTTETSVQAGMILGEGLCTLTAEGRADRRMEGFPGAASQCGRKHLRHFLFLNCGQKCIICIVLII